MGAGLAVLAGGYAGAPWVVALCRPGRGRLGRWLQSQGSRVDRKPNGRWLVTATCAASLWGGCAVAGQSLPLRWSTGGADELANAPPAAMLVIYLFAADSAYQSANEVQRQAKCDGDGFRAFGPANPKVAGSVGSLGWCAGRDSNPQAFRRGILSPLRLPVSPPARRLRSYLRWNAPGDFACPLGHRGGGGG